MLLEGQPIHGLKGEALTAFRGKVQAVFQDPWSSLDPRMTVGRTIAESLIVAGWERPRIAARVEELLRPGAPGAGARAALSARVQRRPAPTHRASRPRLPRDRKLIVLDEPISALDVSIRAQMMNLLKDIQAQDNVAYLLVAHDLATVRHMADQTVVMYLGKVVEHAPTRLLFDDVRHPYTKALFSAVLLARPDQLEEEVVLAGEIPSPLSPPSGCRFHTRCPLAMPRCSSSGAAVAGGIARPPRGVPLVRGRQRAVLRRRAREAP